MYGKTVIQTRVRVLLRYTVIYIIFTLDESSGKRNVSVSRPSVRLSVPSFL